MEKKMLQSPSSKMSDRMWGATTIILGLALVLILGVIGYLMGLQHDLPNARIDGLIGIEYKCKRGCSRKAASPFCFLRQILTYTNRRTNVARRPFDNCVHAASTLRIDRRSIPQALVHPMRHSALQIRVLGWRQARP